MRPRKSNSWRDANRAVRDGAQQLYADILHHLATEYHHVLPSIGQVPGFLRGRNFAGLLTWADSLVEQTYPTATEHFVANQFAALIRKYPWDPKVVKTDPEGRAVETFLKAERKCALLNRKFKLYNTLRSPSKYWDFYGKMRLYIQYILGAEPSLPRIFGKCDFGSGASVGVHGNATHIHRKLTVEKWSCSPCASPLAFAALRTNPVVRELMSPAAGRYWCDDRDLQEEFFLGKREWVGYNMVTFVPKTAKTLRAIAVEPLLNGYIQKGIDQEMRLLLKRVGLDLSDQTRNQRMARQGSLDDSADGFVTIDLSSASDSISTELCRRVLPDAWFDLMNRARSQNFRLNGKVYPYHKFCSMGNGFCFPLETLLFAACCHAAGAGVAGTDFSVYGDDIIVRKKYAGVVLSLLKEMGFTPNKKKTLVEGPFRESCGGDFWFGEDVRPYTLDEKLDNIPAIFKFLNLTRRNERCALFFVGLRDFIIQSVPKAYRYVRPFTGNPDTAIDSSGDEHLRYPSSKWNRKTWMWEWRELVHTAVGDKVDRGTRDQHLAELYAALRGGQSNDRNEATFALRRKTRTTTRGGKDVASGGSGVAWPLRVRRVRTRWVAAFRA